MSKPARNVSRHWYVAGYRGNPADVAGTPTVLPAVAAVAVPAKAATPDAQPGGSSGPAKPAELLDGSSSLGLKGSGEGSQPGPVILTAISDPAHVVDPPESHGLTKHRTLVERAKEKDLAAADAARAGRIRTR
jgi:hypothetical protein